MAGASHDTQVSGHLTAIHGSVVDVRFPQGVLPALNEGIAIDRDEPTPLLAEVQQHLDPVTIRAVTLGNTAGLSRGVVRAPPGRTRPGYRLAMQCSGVC